MTTANDAGKANVPLRLEKTNGAIDHGHTHAIHRCIELTKKQRKENNAKGKKKCIKCTNCKLNEVNPATESDLKKKHKLQKIKHPRQVRQTMMSTSIRYNWVTY